MNTLPNEKARAARIENFALIFIVFALIWGGMTLLQVQGVAPYIIVNICLLLVSRTMLKRDYGADIFRPRHAKRQLLLGSAFGALMFLQAFLILLLIAAVFPISISIFPWLGVGWTAERIALYVASSALMQLSASYAEEAFWRQYCWRALEDAGLPGGAVLLVTTLIFALGHKPGASWLSVAIIGLLGLEFGLLRVKYGEGSFLLTGTAHFTYNILYTFIMQ